ncbi:glycosyltransferase family 4 protein [Bacillus sp. SCS-151]|uniref:glycosyltransferase family 4 protein n=1 Tax=Nanhaiella sioensis TaxID=3115293 RepID=UPI00397BD928
MLKIGLDSRVLDCQHRAGVARYTHNVINEIVKDYEDQFYLLGGPADHLNHLNRISIDLPNYNFEYANKSIELAGNSSDLDLIFSPFYPIPEQRNFKAVLTIHDLIPLKLEEFYKNTLIHQLMDEFIRKTVEHVEHIIAVSNHTKHDIIELFSVEEERITVIYPGLDNIFLSEQEVESTSKSQAILNKYNINKPYILSVCSFEFRKNLQRILNAYEQLREAHNDNIGLVLVGGGLWPYGELFTNIRHSKYFNDIVITGYIPDEHLPTLYKNAETFVYPSLYEGFGFPVIEAMACGTPVVTSNGSSLCEVGGELAVYCDPYKVDSIVSALEETLFKANNYKEATSFKNWARQFSWKKAGEQTRELLFTTVNSIK